MIEAEVIADSISVEDKRITTFRLRYWRAIHAELMTHRVFSRNASSSRAVPFRKLVEEATTFDLMAMPEVWGTEQKGMQTGGELSFDNQCIAEQMWLRAGITASESAKELAAIGVHKSIINRLLEPFTHINVVVTATEWDNFFGLRLDAGAEPTMRVLADAMWKARKASTPKLLLPGQWHLPFVEHNELDLADVAANPQWAHEASIKISVARCARVSYRSFETGKHSTVEEDLRLYDKLLGAQPLHASPAEHQATPLPSKPGPYVIYDAAWEEAKSQQGNFVGWRQYRKMLPGENLAPLPEDYR